MARPRKSGLDFFPHSVDAASDEKIEAMCAVYGNDGYAFYFKLLERIYKNGGILDVQNPAIMAAISRSITADSPLFDQMLQTALDLCLFDRGRYEEEKVLTSIGIQRRAGYVAQERARKRAWKATSESQEVLDVQNPAKITEKPHKHKTINNNIPPISPKEYGQYGWVKLTDEEYGRLINDFGETEVKRCITYVDESAQSSGNKNKWRDWNLVIRRCHRDNWGLKAGQMSQTARGNGETERWDRLE